MSIYLPKVWLANYAVLERQENISRTGNMSLSLKWNVCRGFFLSVVVTYSRARVKRVPGAFRIVFINPLHIQRNRLILLISPHAVLSSRPWKLLLCAVETQEFLTCWRENINSSMQTLLLCDRNTKKGNATLISTTICLTQDCK